MLDKSYINFKLIEKKPKTYVYAIISNSNNSILGYIKWFNSWRQYTFFPNNKTIYSDGCLNEIINFMNKVNYYHRLKMGDPLC